MNRIYITLDTEMDNDEHWGKHFPPEYSSITEGIPCLLRPIWDKYQVHPIYFVSPEVLYSEECVSVLREEIQKGAIIGAHLHPEYIEPNRIWGKEIETVEAEFPCFAYSYEIEKEKLQKLTLLIEEKLGVRPTWYRAARFGADMDTIRILSELGYEVDSSVTPEIDWTSKGGPNHKDASKKKYLISKTDMYSMAEVNAAGIGITEMPVTILGKRWGAFGKILPDNWLFYRWLRPTHMTYIEMKHVIKEMKKSGINEGVMMFHSMEIMIDKTPYVRNKWMQRYFLWRLEKICCFARKQQYTL